MGIVVGVDNFADRRYEETACDTPNVLVLEIPIKDGDNADDVNNIGDDNDEDETVGVGGA